MLGMNRIVFISLFFLSFVVAAEANDALEVVYIANEGFMLESGGDKVLIDALFGKEDLGFCDVPPRALLKKLLAAAPPFDDVDLIVVSHDHLDHFDAEMAAEYLKNNAQCELIGTEQVEASLKKCKDYESLKGRIHGVTPAAESIQKMTVNEIEVSVLRLKHCTYCETDKETGEKIDRHRNMQNIGVIIQLGNNKIFHIGDSGMDNVEEYKAYNLIREEIDIALLGSIFWPPFSIRTDLVNKAIQPKQIVAMHLDRGNKDKYLAYRESIQEDVPPITIFKEPMEQKVFSKAAESD